MQAAGGCPGSNLTVLQYLSDMVTVIQARERERETEREIEREREREIETEREKRERETERESVSMVLVGSGDCDAFYLLSLACCFNISTCSLSFSHLFCSASN